MPDYRAANARYINVLHDKENNIWVGFVYNGDAFEEFQKAEEGSGAELKPIDVYAALDEVVLLSRIKKEHSALLIGNTDGEVQSIPW